MTNPTTTAETLSATPRPVAPLDDNLIAYIISLTTSTPSFSFRTGSGRILRDLLLHWPVLENYEDEALALCQRIADDVFPLVSSLHAQAVELSVTFSATPIDITTPETRSTLLLFDINNRQEYESFLSPEQSHFTTPLSLAKGIAVLCRPLNVNYHTLKDDRARGNRPGIGIFEWAKRQLDALYEIPDFVPQERGYLYLLSKNLQNRPENRFRTEIFTGSQAPPRHSPDEDFDDEDYHEEISAAEENHTPSPKPIVTSLSALPVMLRNFERQAMAYVMDAHLSPRLRAGLRHITQHLLADYPQALFAETARAETTLPSFKKETPHAASPQPTLLPTRLIATKTISPPSPPLQPPQTKPVFSTKTFSAVAPAATPTSKPTASPILRPVMAPPQPAAKISAPQNQPTPAARTPASVKQEAAPHADTHTPELALHAAPYATSAPHSPSAPHSENSPHPTAHPASSRKTEAQPSYRAKNEIRAAPKAVHASYKEEKLHALFESAGKQEFKAPVFSPHVTKMAFPKATPILSTGKLDHFTLKTQPSPHSLSIRKAEVKKFSHFILEKPGFEPAFFFPHPGD